MNFDRLNENARARKALGFGLDAVLTPELVKAAFTERAKESHPDTGGAGADMAELKKAREVLLSHLEAQNNTCKWCGGSGMVTGRVGARPCMGCSGKGVRQ